MIAVDTNVLLRRLLDDDAAQAERARRLFARNDQVLITDIVLAEAVWTLRGKRYKATKDDIIAAVTALLEEPNVAFESRQAVWAALNDYADAPLVRTRYGVNSADLADALIVRKATFTAQRWGESYDATYTFDQAALTIPGTRAP
jgi:predicted nucleic-acid-binding protein